MGPLVGTNLFNPGTSKVLFERRVKSDRTITARVTALLEISVPSPGTQLRVTAQEATISRQPLLKGTMVISEDSSLQTWTDNNLKPGQGYEYRIVAFKNVKTVPRSQGQPPAELITSSGTSAPIEIVAMDRRVPVAPVIVQAQWIDLNNDPIAMPAESSRLRLIIEAASDTSQFLVQRNAPRSDVWNSVLIDGLRGWRPWPSGVTRLTVIAEAIGTTDVSRYRALIRTIGGRQSGPSQTVSV